MATIYDVAKRARVSTYTVSAVLNQSAFVSPELTKRVREAVAELDYTINELARGLQSRKTRTIGMLIPDIANPFYAKVVRGVEDILREAGYSLILGNTYNKPEEQLRYCGVFRARQVDGLLLFVAPGEGAEVRRMVDAKKPVVFVGRAPSDYEADTVTADNVLGTRLATEHLIAKGHRRIALITGHASITANVERVLGWRRAFRKAGLKADPRWACDGDWSAQSGYDAACRLLAMEERPTAIFAASFLMLTGVLRAVQESGLRCPEDVEAMGSDNSEWLDVFQPRISTIVQPSYSMGAGAAELLLKRIQSPEREFEKVVLKPSLKIR